MNAPALADTMEGACVTDLRVCLWHEDEPCDCHERFAKYPDFPIWKIAEMDGWLCSYCYKHVGRYAVREHVHPRSKGGSDSVVNLVIACGTCNTRKSNLMIDDWLLREQARGRLHELPGLCTIAAEFYGVNRQEPTSEEPMLLADGRLMQWAIDTFKAA